MHETNGRVMYAIIERHYMKHGDEEVGDLH